MVHGLGEILCSVRWSTLNVVKLHLGTEPNLTSKFHVQLLIDMLCIQGN